MGCSTSSQTSAVDTTRPGAKPEECNGATTGVAGDNGKIAEDSETIPDQTPADGASSNPPAGEEAQSSPAEAAAPAEASTETPAAESNAETAASSSDAAAPEQEATATDSETKAEEAPAPSE